MNEFPSDPDQPLNDPIVPSCPPVADSPRQRVSAHMKRLLKSAAAGAAIGTSACLVCDPLPPPPPDCSMNLTDDDLARSVSAYARWVTVSGVPAVTVSVAPYFGTNLLFTAPPTLQGGALGSVVLTDRDLTFLFTPEDGVTSVQVAVPMSCDAFPIALNLSLDVTASPGPNQPVPVRFGNR